MKNKENNFAYIDGNNLYRGVNNSGWRIDFFRLREWLKDKVKNKVSLSHKEKTPAKDKP